MWILCGSLWSRDALFTSVYVALSPYMTMPKSPVTNIQLSDLMTMSFSVPISNAHD